MSFSFFKGTPYKTINSSPTILSNVPLYLKTTSIIDLKYLFKSLTISDGLSFSDMLVKPLISEKRIVTSLSVPPKFNESSLSRSLSTIFLDTYFLKVDLTLFILDKSSKATTIPEKVSLSSKTGEQDKFTVIFFLPTLSINSLSKTLSWLTSTFWIISISWSLFSKIII